MIIQSNQSVFSKKYSKKLNSARISIRKIEVIIENQALSTHRNNHDEYDIDDLLFNAQISLWSSLEGFANYLISLLGFRNNDCELYFLTSPPSPESFYLVSQVANAAYIITSEKEVFYYNRISLPSLEKIKNIDDAKFEQLNELFSLNQTSNSSVEKVSLISKKISPKDLYKLNKIVGEKHIEIHNITDKLNCLINLINSINKQKLLKYILSRTLENKSSFENDRTNLIESLNLVKNIMINLTINKEGKIRNNNIHLNLHKLVKKEVHRSLEDAEQGVKDFYNSVEFSSYPVYGLTIDLVKTTFSSFEDFIKKCTNFFKKHLESGDIFIQFEDSMLDEKSDRIQLHNLLVNIPHNVEVPLASGTFSVVEF